MKDGGTLQKRRTEMPLPLASCSCECKWALQKNGMINNQAGQMLARSLRLLPSPSLRRINNPALARCASPGSECTGPSSLHCHDHVMGTVEWLVEDCWLREVKWVSPGWLPPIPERESAPWKFCRVHSESGGKFRNPEPAH